MPILAELFYSRGKDAGCVAASGRRLGGQGVAAAVAKASRSRPPLELRARRSSIRNRRQSTETRGQGAHATVAVRPRDVKGTAFTSMPRTGYRDLT